MREKEVTISAAASCLERAERCATSNPKAAIPLLQEALKACAEVGLQCLESRAYASLGITLALVDRLPESERAFEQAYKPNCPCCRPIIDRNFARLLDIRNDLSEALRYADRAVEGSSTKAQKGPAFVTLGIVRYHAGDIPECIQAFTKSLEIIPVSSHQHSIAMKNLNIGLAHSGSLKDLELAIKELTNLAARFKGVRRVSLERANLAWTTGQSLARLVRIAEHKAWTRREHLNLAQAHLTTAVNAMERLGLPLAVAAIRTDLAAIQALLDPLAVADTLGEIPAQGEQEDRQFDLSEAKTNAIEAAGGILSPERIQKMWKALRDLRDATVVAGIAPPIMMYAVPS
jgi:tetratricopeptide (TPR) repeat protein